MKWLADVAAGKVGLDGTTPVKTDDPVAPFPILGNGRIAVVTSPVIYDQKTLDKMDAAK